MTTNKTIENNAYTSSTPAANQVKIPVLQEELHIGKRQVETGEGIRIHKTVSERTENVDIALKREQIGVKRIPVGIPVEADAKPQVRYEGNVLVIPVFEEVLVVEKKVLLKEEIHITCSEEEYRQPHAVVLQSEEITIEPFDHSPSSPLS